MGYWKFNTKQIIVCAIFGGSSFALRAANIVFPIGGPFVIDARGIPGVIGAALSGPVGGICTGILAGMPAKFPLVDIPSFTLAYFLVGLLSRRFKWLSGLGTLVGYPIAAAIVWQIGLLPSFIMAMLLLAPRMIVVPIQLAILYTILKRWPKIIEVIQK